MSGSVEESRDTTDLADIDLFGEVTGIGGYKEVKALSVTLSLFGFEQGQAATQAVR